MTDIRTCVRRKDTDALSWIRALLRVVLRLFGRVLIGACASATLLALFAWQRTYHVGDSVRAGIAHAETDFELRLFSTPGGMNVDIEYVTWPRDFSRKNGRLFQWTASPAPNQALPATSWWERAGFRYRYESGPADSSPESITFLRIGIPCWVVFALSAVAPATWIIRRTITWRRLVPRIPTACRLCGYDLRGGHASGRCPECGAPAGQTIPAAPPPA